MNKTYVLLICLFPYLQCYTCITVCIIWVVGLTGSSFFCTVTVRALVCNDRVAVVGNVDAGKSTLLGVLTHAELDNGRGYARQKLFRHKHEMESGRTSSVGNDILGFDSRGAVVNKPEHGSLDWVKICEKASKVRCMVAVVAHGRLVM